ncbi:hypothetical protein COCNU_05G010600 [Cocos nucifera]|uniref:Uncharacterized protein n=1 Tax=Cocos nucifera TaxID=13894 RepID=A0A8K0IAA8_COCNU|nr:hypothetical protein COCNU_05G010600 [Cocos nucifera]
MNHVDVDLPSHGCTHSPTATATPEINSRRETLARSPRVWWGAKRERDNGRSRDEEVGQSRRGVRRTCAKPGVELLVVEELLPALSGRILSLARLRSLLRSGSPVLDAHAHARVPTTYGLFWADDRA